MATKNYIQRLLDPAELLKHKSILLLGPRQTGKTSLLRHTLKDTRTYNLLDSDDFLKLSRRPALIREELTPADATVVIDEIHELPELLDEVQRLIEERGTRFVLTGSSVRTLKLSGANPLGGRLATATLHPFVSAEIAEFDLPRALQFGLLPPVYFSARPEANLSDYLAAYIKEEIATKGLTRNITAFSRFLEAAALCNGRQINFTNMANDAQVARTTVHEYFEILKDTLLAYELPAWQETVKRKPVKAPKFYFFDVGVARALLGGGPLRENSAEFGSAFESLLFQELHSYTDYKLGRQTENLHYWRSKSGFEVDFILEGKTAVEVTAARNVSPHDLRGLRAIAEGKLSRLICVSREPESRLVDGIEILPWHVFLKRLWAGEYR